VLIRFHFPELKLNILISSIPPIIILSALALRTILYAIKRLTVKEGVKGF
jgi:hypothetical protein